MKKLQILILLIFLSSGSLWAQLAYNPFTQNIHFQPEPTVAGFQCGSTPNVEFTAGMTTADSATDWQNNPLIISVCITGFEFDGTNPAALVTGSYASNFTWTFDPFTPNCLIGTQNQTLYGTGTNPIFPDPRSSGNVNVALKVPVTSPLNTVLAVNVNLTVPAYMASFNSAPDDTESTQTQTYCALNISGTVFYDTVLNPAGIDFSNPIGNPGGQSLCASLVDSNGNVVDTTHVALNGTYSFLDVGPSQTYEVVLSTICGTIGNPPPTPQLPLGWSNTAEDCCDATGTDGNTNGKTNVTVGLVSVDEVNFGITQLMSLGNTVWNDINQNGVRDNGEPGISGATINLYEDNNTDGTPDGAAVQTTTSTGSNGLYLFDGLKPGSYLVGVTPPAPSSGPAFISSVGAGQEANPNSDGDNNDNGITLVGAETRSGTITLIVGTEPNSENPNNDNTKPDSNSNLTIDFGFYQPIKIAGNVYNDLNGPANVDGTPLHNPANTQLYANLVDPSGNVVAVDPINPNGTYEFTNVIPNTTYKVVLSDTAGTVGNATPQANLPFGWENVSEDCCDNTGNDGNANGEVTVVLGTTDLSNANFGIREPLSIGNTVWNDIDQDGLRGATEVGIPGATVKLYADNNTDGVPDGPAIATTVTAGANGYYLFDGLNAGSYVIGVTPPVPTSGPAWKSSNGLGEETNPNADGDNNDNGIILVGSELRSGFITISIGGEPTGENPSNDNAKPDSNSNLTVDFGFYQPLKIAGNVYNDQNGPTNVDGTPINNPSGAQVYASLVNAAGIVVAVDPVNANGTYEFNDVSPNTTYKVVMSTVAGVVNGPAPTPSLPFGWENVSEDCCDNTGNDGTTNGEVTVVLGTTDLNNANFGIRQPMSLGNMVWNDVNQNGLRDNGEGGIVGATVNLYEDANTDGTPDGAAIATTTTTGVNGFYLFDGLNPGSYIVGVTPPATSGAAYVSYTGVNEEANPNLDGDHNDNGVVQVGAETRSGFITLAVGTEPNSETPSNDNSKPDSNSNLTLDFAFFQPLKIAGNVFNDQNGATNVDGTPIGQASGNQLFANLVGPSGNVLAVDTVNSNGTYEFFDVTPNTIYTIVLTDASGSVGNPAPVASLPNGWTNVSEDCCDNVGNDGTTNGLLTANVVTSDLTNANFGIREPLALGNMVWNDVNKNGIQDNTEGPITGATVRLYEDFNNDNTPDGAAIATVVTGSNGLYNFEGLETNNYIVGVTPPVITGATYVSSVTGEEANPNLNIDSNDNGVTQIGLEIRTNSISLSPGTEPAGELPNNTPLTPDSNANLTIDFGFFECPAGFTFSDYNLCANTTVDLTSFEPVNYTGGTWTLNGQAVTTPTAVNTAGTYTYTFTNGTCTTTGTLTVINNIPDYTPTIQIAPSAITGTSNVRVIINITELLNFDACSDVFVIVPKLVPRYIFNYVDTASVIGGIPVKNVDWQFFGNANPNFYIWKYVGTGGVYPAGAASTFGYIGAYDPNNTDGQSTFSVQVFQGSGGETNQTNNTDSDLLIYFR